MTLLALVFTVSSSHYTSNQSDQNSDPSPTPTPTPTPSPEPTQTSTSTLTPTPSPTPDQNEKPIYDVRIIEFEWTSDWVKGPVPGDWRFRNFITPIQNFGDIDVDGLTVEVRIIANNSELETGTAILYGTLEGVLYGGESRELIGRVNIVLDELEQASGEWSNKIIVMLDDLVLYELSIP